MKRTLKIFAIVALLLICFTATCMASLGWLWRKLTTSEMAPPDYMTKVATGGELEAKYLAYGTFEVKVVEIDAPEPMKRYDVFYPSALEEKNDVKFPLVVFVSGTGVGAFRYPTVLKRLASWGFVVVGNQDPSTFNGNSTDQTLAYMLSCNEDKNSVFCGKVDANRIGIIGHSQGGVGVFNAITNNEHSALYRCAVSLSPTGEKLANAIGMVYDVSKVTIPTFMIMSSRNDVLSPQDMAEMYDRISAEKVMITRKKSHHGEMLYAADGYVTAWFMWKLQDDQEAAKAFVGDEPEIMNNPLYENQRIDLTP